METYVWKICQRTNCYAWNKIPGFGLALTAGLAADPAVAGRSAFEMSTMSARLCT